MNCPGCIGKRIIAVYYRWIARERVFRVIQKPHLLKCPWCRPHVHN